MTVWRHLFPQDQRTAPAQFPIPSAPQPFAAMEVIAAGLCCAVGHDLAAASCALRANMDHFQASKFMTPQGDPLLVARLPEDKLWGRPRIVKWLIEAARDCLGITAHDASELADMAASEKQGPWHSNDASCALLVLAPRADPYAPQAGPPGSAEAQAANMALQVAQALNLNPHPASGVLSTGRAGLAQALELASAWLAAGELRGLPLHSVLLLAADSLLDVDLIDQFLADQRLLCPGNGDGFIPGEAAAALLLRAAPVRPAMGHAQPADTDQRRLRIVGMAEGLEPARWSGGVPNRSTGLTEAVRAACERAGGVRPQELSFRVSDQNGESFYSREAATAFARLRLGASSQASFPHVTLADKIGEVGVATGVAALAWLSHLWERQQRLPGTRRLGEWGTGVVHLSQDDGRRAAVIVEPR